MKQMKPVELIVHSRKTPGSRAERRYVCAQHERKDISELVQSKRFREHYGVIERHAIGTPLAIDRPCPVCEVTHAQR